MSSVASTAAPPTSLTLPVSSKIASESAMPFSSARNSALASFLGDPEVLGDGRQLAAAALGVAQHGVEILEHVDQAGHGIERTLDGGQHEGAELGGEHVEVLAQLAHREGGRLRGCIERLLGGAGGIGHALERLLEALGVLAGHREGEGERLG